MVCFCCDVFVSRLFVVFFFRLLVFFFRLLVFFFSDLKVCFFCLDPERQFQLVIEHCHKLRETEGHIMSKIYIYVERNLGFEAEHHRRALGNAIPNCQFYLDEQHDRVGVLTTNEVKHAMAQLTVLMLEEHRLHMRKPHLVSRDPKGIMMRLREQMEVYSYQFKAAQTTFQKDAVALSGKVGGMKDDICICLQLACYFTQLEKQREHVNLKRLRT